MEINLEINMEINMEINRSENTLKILKVYREIEALILLGTSKIY